MTAINIFKLPGSVHLFCDTWASIDGAKVGNAVKCLPVPHLHAAIATRGEAIVLPAMLRLISQFESYRDLRDGLAPSSREFSQVEAALQSDWDAFVIGWAANGPDAFAVFSHSKHGVPAFKACDIPHGIITPTLTQAAIDRLSEEVGNVLARARATMELQQRMHPGTVGGQIIETMVDAVGIHTRMLARLPEAKRGAPWPSEPSREVRLPGVFAKYLEGANG